MNDFIEKVHLRNKQRYINKMMEEEGLTDELLMQQVELNRRRHAHDVNDSKDYVQ